MASNLSNRDCAENPDFFRMITLKQRATAPTRKTAEPSTSARPYACLANTLAQSSFMLATQMP